MFGGRYKWTLVKSNNYYFNVLKYVFLNPCKAGIEKKAEEYPYSTLYSQINKNHFPGLSSPFFDVLDDNFLSWINKSHTEEQDDCIKRGLSRTKFKYAGTRQNRDLPIFENFK